jgi:hypothetical protein
LLLDVVTSQALTQTFEGLWTYRCPESCCVFGGGS